MKTPITISIIGAAAGAKLDLEVEKLVQMLTEQILAAAK